MRGPGARRGVRVIAGAAGGRRLQVPPGGRVRPTADRVKEALFARLGSARLAGAAVLDLYAGTGSLAIEALSRGAARAVCVERDPAALDTIRRNLRAVGLADAARVVRDRVERFVRRQPPAEAPFDLVLCDPPYAVTNAELGWVLEALRSPGWLGDDALVVLEREAHSGPPPLPADWEVTWQRAYGDTLVTVADAHAATGVSAPPRA